MKKPKIISLVGTRPEIIKLSQVLLQLDSVSEHIFVHSGQNYDYELSEVFFKNLGLRKPDHFLNSAKATAIETIASVLVEFDKLLAQTKPDAMLIYGDTNSALSVLCAKKRRIPIFHMEAGNRSFDARVPEEVNRKVVDHLSDVNMTITEHARRYLVREGLPPDLVVKVGSSMQEIFAKHKAQIEASVVLKTLNLNQQKYFVVSLHREENVDDPSKLTEFLGYIDDLAAKYKLPIIFSVHPRTAKRIQDGGEIQLNPLVRMLKPLGLFDYIALQKNSLMVISDSGTITEECSLLGFRALTPRDAHERPEGTDSGTLIKSPIDRGRLLHATEVTLQAPAPTQIEDFGDEHLSIKVVKIILSNIDSIRRRVYFQDSVRSK